EDPRQGAAEEDSRRADERVRTARSQAGGQWVAPASHLSLWGRGRRQSRQVRGPCSCTAPLDGPLTRPFSPTAPPEGEVKRALRSIFTLRGRIPDEPLPQLRFGRIADAGVAAGRLCARCPDGGGAGDRA